MGKKSKELDEKIKMKEVDHETKKTEASTQ